MVADNNKNDEVRQLYKENGRDQIYPVVIKDSLSDGNGKYGDDAFGTWFRTTDMETKSLSVCEDADFYNESTSKPNFKYIQVKDSSMLINMPLTVGGVKDSDGKWSVDALNVKTKNVSIECNEAIAIDSSKLTVKAKGMSAKITIDSSVFEIFSAGTDAKKNIQLLIGGEKTSLTQFVSDKFTFTDTNGANYLTIDDSSGFTFNKQITMTQGLTVYCETDRNFTIQAKNGAAGLTINITEADDMTGMLNISKMTVNLDASTNVTVNGVGTFGSLITGYNNTTYIDSDNKWSSNRLLFTNNNYALDTTGGGSHYGIVSTGRRIVALDSSNQITPLVLNYPLSDVHSSVQMYDASIANDASITNKLTVNGNLVLSVLSNIATVKGEVGLTLTTGNSIGDISINPGNSKNNIKLQIEGKDKLTVSDSSVMVGATYLCIGASGDQTRLSSNTGGQLYSETSMTTIAKNGSIGFILYDDTEEFQFDYYIGGTHNYKLVIDSSVSTFTNEVKAKVNGVNNVYLDVPIGTIVMWSSKTCPTHWIACDGSYISRTTYSKLYSVIGDAFSLSSDTDTTKFRLPDLCGRFPIGVGSYSERNTSGETSYSYNIGNSGGEAKHVLTVSEMPTHNHNSSSSTTTGNITTTSNGSHSHGIPTGNSTTSTASSAQKGDNSNYGSFNCNSAGSHTHSVRLYARGSGADHENRPPFIALYFIIKYE